MIKHIFKKTNINFFNLQKCFTTATPTPNQASSISNNKNLTPEEYEKEFNKIFLEKTKIKKDFLEKELNEKEKREVNTLVGHLIKMDKNEKLYYLLLNRKNEIKVFNEDTAKVNIDLPQNIINTENFWPKENPNWLKTPALTSTLASFSGQAMPVQVAAPIQEQKKSENQEQTAQVQQDKSHYELKLVSFDATKKIALIKEVRAITSLGLKESKELVEKAPTVIKKDVKKEEAEELKKKLTENGAVIELL